MLMTKIEDYTAMLMTKILVALTLGMTILAASGIWANGWANFWPNGVTVNGYSNNGVTINGYTTNGLTQNGYTQNGLTQNGYTQNGYTNNGLTQNGLVDNGLTQNGGQAAARALRVIGIELPPMPWCASLALARANALWVAAGSRFLGNVFARR
jgi:hypothetical protein